MDVLFEKTIEIGSIIIHISMIWMGYIIFRLSFHDRINYYIPMWKQRVYGCIPFFYSWYYAKLPKPMFDYFVFFALLIMIMAYYIIIHNKKLTVNKSKKIPKTCKEAIWDTSTWDIWIMTIACLSFTFYCIYI